MCMSGLYHVCCLLFMCSIVGYWVPLSILTSTMQALLGSARLYKCNVVIVYNWIGNVWISSHLLYEYCRNLSVVGM